MFWLVPDAEDVRGLSCVPGAGNLAPLMSANPIPDGYPAITPYLIIDGAARAIDFYKQVFGATERMRMAAGPDRIGHAEIVIGSSMLMLADEFPDIGAVAPKGGATTPVSLHLYIENVDDVVKRAEAAGAKIHRPVETKFYGDRSGSIIDPFGHHWTISTHVEDVPEEEMKRRMAAMKPPGA
jgi:PhnB protein